MTIHTYAHVNKDITVMDHHNIHNVHTHQGDDDDVHNYMLII